MFMFLRIAHSSLLVSATFLIASCGPGSPDYNPDIGPFDKDGNYVEAWADNPPKRKKSSRSAAKKPQSAPKPAPVVERRPAPSSVSSTPKPKPVYKPAPKPKPKPKPPVKPKPKYRSHKVVKGDTLYGLGRKYGVSVSAIQKANGMSGTSIRDGRTLKIPLK